MRTVLLILSIAFASMMAAQTPVIVTDKDDARLIAYQDSMKLYLYGQYQIQVSKFIINKKDTSGGNMVMRMIAKYAKSYRIFDENDGRCILHEKRYTHCYVIDRLTFACNMSVNGDPIDLWSPDVYKKPIQPVIYKINNPLPKKKKLLPKLESDEKPIPVVAQKKKDKSLNDTILMPSGERITRADFENRYGTKTYNFETSKNQVK